VGYPLGDSRRPSERNSLEARSASKDRTVMRWERHRWKFPVGIVDTIYRQEAHMQSLRSRIVVVIVIPMQADRDRPWPRKGRRR